MKTILFALLPLQCFCDQYLVCYENLGKEITKIEETGFVIQDVIRITVNDHLDKTQGDAKLKAYLAEKNLVMYRIRYK